MKSIPKFLLSLVLCFGAAIIGSVFTRMSVSTWYLELAKPALAPPNWIFAPVWNILYFLMAVAIYLVWIKDVSATKQKATYAFYFQLLLNIFWSVVFFGLRSPLAGLVVIGILIFAIALTISYFARISKVSSYLLWPYLLWVCFASYLNYQLWILNY